jgi:PAS domain S-box-containing protein
MIDAVVMALDSEGRVRHWSDGAQRVLGYSAAETIGRSAGALLTPGQPPEVEIARRRAIYRNGSWQGEITMQHRDGTPVTLYTRSAKVEQSGSVFASIDVAVETTDWKEQHARSDEARSYLGAIANSMADGLYAVTADGRLAFMNPAAERALGWTTADLKGRVMHSVVHYQHPDGTAFPAHECPAMQAPNAGETVKVDDCTFTRRDGTLLPVSYTASPIKSGSKITGSVVVFTDISERKAETERLERELLELTWVERLQEALDGERVMLYAQPVVKVATGAVEQYKLGVRVLIDGELVPPEDFMEYAEEHSVVTEIDRWVLRRMCKMAAEGATVKYAPAARSLRDPLVRSEFKRLLQASGADPSKIVLDITEAAVLGDPESATQFAKVMHAMGCQLGLGNFGTGFGGFPYLANLRVQYLKVNTQFVRDLAHQTANQHVVGAAVDLASRFGLATIADGVDSPATLDALRALGVDYARGPALGHFGPAREVVRGPAG